MLFTLELQSASFQPKEREFKNTFMFKDLINSVYVLRDTKEQLHFLLASRKVVKRRSWLTSKNHIKNKEN